MASTSNAVRRRRLSTDPVSDIADQFEQLLSKRPILFAGAGVGKRAGLPDWHQYMEYLAETAAAYEIETAQLIRKRTSQDRLPEAAHLYKICTEIPDGERWRGLAAPFDQTEYQTDGLVDLVSLPFSAIVTTNYDRSLHQAAARARNVWTRPLELDDSTLKQGHYLDDFYIARIHGRAELPTSMVIDTDDYDTIADNAEYGDFLLHVLTRCSCLFLGFSFLDPAIKNVLATYARRFGPVFRSLHAALLPSNADALRQRLEQYNIRTIVYPPGKHDVVWSAIKSVAGKARLPLPPAGTTPPRSVFDTVRRFLSACYVRLKLTQEIEPLRTLILEGLVLGLVCEADGRIGETALVTNLRSVLALGEEDAAVAVARSVAGLSGRRLCDSKDGFVTLLRPVENPLERDISVLVNGVLNRLSVREGVRNPEEHRELIRTLIEEIVLERGWDLGAHFAAARSSDTFDLVGVVRSSADRHLGSGSRPDKERIVRACYDLIKSPDDREAQILIEFGRLSFGIDIAVERPRGALLWESALPTRVYLDASVVLPMIAPGHPKGSAYIETVKQLVDAGKSSGLSVRTVVYEPFLNEIIHHRRIAREAVLNHGLGDARRMGTYLGFQMGRENVFLTSYATSQRSDEPVRSFADFLVTVAPYETEEALAEFLRKQGFTVEKALLAKGEEGEHNRLRTGLHKTYSDDEEWRVNQKPNVLIDHEALQLWRLERDARTGLRPAFVTADMRLRRLLNESSLFKLSGLVLSPLALVQLVDLLVGVQGEARSLARLVWGVRALEGPDVLQEYFISKGLRFYFGEAFAQGVPALVDIVGTLAREADERAAREGVKFSPVSDRDIEKTLGFLEGFETRFYEKMRKEIERHNRS